MDTDLRHVSPIEVIGQARPWCCGPLRDPRPEADASTAARVSNAWICRCHPANGRCSTASSRACPAIVVCTRQGTRRRRSQCAVEHEFARVLHLLDEIDEAWKSPSSPLAASASAHSSIR